MATTVELSYTGTRRIYTIPSDYSVGTLSYTLIGGSGGGGGNDAGRGANGGAGRELQGSVTIRGGDVIEVGVGGGGKRGRDGRYNTTGGAGGESLNGFNGGNGGNAGPRPWSGSGGGGGGATVIKINGVPVAVAAGGGGGGGGGCHSNGVSIAEEGSAGFRAFATNHIDGGRGQDHPGDGGGGGGGGGGLPSGLGGGCGEGDNGGIGGRFGVSIGGSLIQDLFVGTEVFSTFNLIDNITYFKATLDRRWVDFLNRVGIWDSAGVTGGNITFDRTAYAYFPYTGFYKIICSCDDIGDLYINGIKRINGVSFRGTASNTVYIEAGIRSIRMVGVNAGGGPRGFGATITYEGKVGAGQGGASYADNATDGQNGSATLTFDLKSRGIYTKDTFDTTFRYFFVRRTRTVTAWREIQKVYTKVAGTWRECQQVWTKVNGVWQKTLGVTEPVVSFSSTSTDWGKLLDNTVCISIIDEDDDIRIDRIATWATFRGKFPSRPFYILDPGGIYGGVFTPANFRTDANAFGPITVNRDNNAVANASDWFTICNLGSLPAGSFVSLWYDTSGSMRLSTIQASYNIFVDKCKAAGLNLFVSYGNDEDWITPHIKDSF